MKSRTGLAVLSLLPAAVFSVAATGSSTCSTLDAGDATTPDDDVIACEDVAYLGGCDDAQAGKFYAQHLSGAVPLEDTAPQESFTAGAGCGTPEDPAFTGAGHGNPYYDLSVRGYFLGGNPGSIAVELHDIHASRQRTGGDINLTVRVSVDGTSMFGTEDFNNAVGGVMKVASAIEVPVEPISSETGISEKLEFTVIDVYDAFPELFEAGAGADFRDVEVTVSFSDARGQHVPVWGAAEVPANVRFNTAPAGTLVQAGTGFILGRADG